MLNIRSKQVYAAVAARQNALNHCRMGLNGGESIRAHMDPANDTAKKEQRGKKEPRHSEYQSVEMLVRNAPQCRNCYLSDNQPGSTRR